MPSETRLISIVVLGNMNPPIHHPAWYADQQIIDDNDLTFAVGRPEMFCSTPLSQFVLPKLRIVCAQERWEIITQAEDAQDRILDIAAKVFKILAETPISAYGFNFHFDRITQCTNVAKTLSQQLRSLRLGIPEIDGYPTFTHKWTEAVKANQLVLASSDKDPSLVSISINNHYNLEKIVPKAKRFDLDRLLAEYFPKDLSAANELASKVADAFSEKVK